MLYHGTRTNKPELIYRNKNQSFNINYLNKGSFGKGMYFSKNTQYSHSYCYIDSNKKKQMFYCLVLAGHSEIYNGTQNLNANYRDNAKKIRYESAISTKNQEIFVVFKNRRAYPLYLITYQK